MFKNYELKKQNEKLKEQIIQLHCRINDLQEKEKYNLEKIEGYRNAIRFKNEVAEELIQENKYFREEKEETEQRALHLSRLIKLIEDTVKTDEDMYKKIKKALTKELEQN